jgi:hypothetical protein
MKCFLSFGPLDVKLDHFWAQITIPLMYIGLESILDLSFGVLQLDLSLLQLCHAAIVIL